MNVGPAELLLVLVLGVLWLVVPIFVGYWVIRIAVRHGILDAQRRSPGSWPPA